MLTIFHGGKRLVIQVLALSKDPVVQGGNIWEIYLKKFGCLGSVDI